jgi:hypothetical protein
VQAYAAVMLSHAAQAQACSSTNAGFSCSHACRCELRAASPRVRKRIDAEDAYLDLWRLQLVPVHVFRLAGIYGLGRSALDALDKLSEVCLSGAFKCRSDSQLPIVHATLLPLAAYACAFKLAYGHAGDTV